MNLPMLAVMRNVVERTSRLSPRLRVPPFEDIKELIFHRRFPLSIYYAPFNYVARDAKIVVVGVTPGWRQMAEALNSASFSLRNGMDTSTAERRAKYAASFRGTMRDDLIDMLDELGVSEKLCIASTAELFSTSTHLLHATSCVMFPTFWTFGHQTVDGTVYNYNGTSPNLLSQFVLEQFVDEHLGPELASLPDALIVPLGSVAREAVKRLHRKGIVNTELCLTGFPHTSGLSRSRWEDFQYLRDTFRKIVAKWNP